MRTKNAALIAVFGLMLLALSPFFARLGYSWAGPHLDAPLLVFDRRDPNLVLMILLIAVTPLVYWICPGLFKPKPKISLRECVVIGVTVSGLIGFNKAVFGGDYLSTAQQYAVQYGYTACSEDIFSEAILAVSTDACAEPGLFWPIQAPDA